MPGTRLIHPNMTVKHSNRAVTLNDSLKNYTKPLILMLLILIETL